jgi:predicted  nucleic acid-binding Zn-ribbon protein
MEQKARFLLFGLVGVVLVCAVFLAQALKAKQDLTRERDDLQKQVASLDSKLDSIQRDRDSLQKQKDSLNKDLMRVSGEKKELQDKYDAANQAKESLMAKLKERQGPALSQPVSQGAYQAAPQGDDAYWGSVLQAKLDLEMQLVNVRNELKSISITNEQLQREKSTLELQIKSFKRESEDAKRQMDYNKKILDRISAELVTEKNDKTKIQDSLKVVKNENATLLRQIEGLNSRKIELEQKLRQIQEDKGSMERKFKDMEGLLSENISQVNELKDRLESGVSAGASASQPARTQKGNGSVELPPIVVRPQGAGTAGNRSTGKVLAINKEGNFVIVDMGENAGLQNGDTFIAYREGKRVASLEVIKVSETVSACDIKKQEMPIKIGDLIK